MGLQAIEPIATAEVVNGQMSWAKCLGQNCTKPPAGIRWRQFCFSASRRTIWRFYNRRSILEQEIYNDLETVLLIHQWPQTPAQKPTPNKAKRNSSLFFRFFRVFLFFLLLFFHFFSLFSLNFCFTSIFSLNFRLFYHRSLQIFGVSYRSESCEIRFFFRFQAKRNFRFNFKFRFRSESEGAP